MVLSDRLADYLERDLLVKFAVITSCQEYSAHTTVADFPLNRVVAELLVDPDIFVAEYLTYLDRGIFDKILALEM